MRHRRRSAATTRRSARSAGGRGASRTTSAIASPNPGRKHLGHLRSVPQRAGGALLLAGDPRLVPSKIDLDEPRDYTGDIDNAALYPNNMACPRDTVLAMGGFDERIVPAGEDGEFCYRWLRAGKRMRHVPEMVVWHREWRPPEELERLYVDYFRGLGMFYAKHLLAGDLTMLRFIGSDGYQGLRSLYAARVRGVERWEDPRRGVFSGLPRGLRDGWREFRPGRRKVRPGGAAEGW